MLPTVFGENLFDDFFDDSFGMMNARSPLYGKHARNLMKTDIRETDTNYELAIDLPGFKKDEIHIELKNGYLTISAAKGRQTDNLLSEARKHLPNNGLMFPEDDLTDKSERFLASEYIREKVFRLLGDELPYATAVEIEKFEVEGNLRRIFAAIVVDRESHKAIVIGKGGDSLKRIASEARQDMERLFDGKVYLEVWVKVKSGWNDDERLLKSLGYE